MTDKMSGTDDAGRGGARRPEHPDDRARALRANLLRRKAQARGRAAAVEPRTDKPEEGA